MKILKLLKNKVVMYMHMCAFLVSHKDNRIDKIIML